MIAIHGALMSKKNYNKLGFRADKLIRVMSDARGLTVGWLDGNVPSSSGLKWACRARCRRTQRPRQTEIRRVTRASRTSAHGKHISWVETVSTFCFPQPSWLLSPFLSREKAYRPNGPLALPAVKRRLMALSFWDYVCRPIHLETL